MADLSIQVTETSLDQMFELSSQLYRKLIQKNLIEKEPQQKCLHRNDIPLPAVKNIERVTQELNTFIDVLAAAELENINLDDSRDFTEFYLSKYGLKAPDDFTTTMGGDDLIEAYTFEHLQIFRNMVFMRSCGYSVSEVLAYDWPQLYERSHIITQQLIETTQAVDATLQTVDMKIDPHLMKERFSESRRVHKVTFKKMGPLFDKDNKLAGYIVSSSVEVVDKDPNRHELRFI